MGLESPSTIDLITWDETSQTCVLIISETNAWSGSDHQLLSLQEKVENYATFVVSGQLTSAYPQYDGCDVRIQLDHTCPLDSRTRDTLNALHAALSDLNLDVKSNQL